MRIPIEKIGPEGLDVDESVATDWLAQALGENAPFRPTAEGHVSVHLERTEEVVRVSGRARIVLEGQCARCLGPVPLALNTPLNVTLVPRGEEPLPGLEGELDADEMGVACYEEEEIDLANVLHDEVFLELPMNVVCSEACAGLCPSCGKNLNEGPCGCEPPSDERWQALKRIKLS